MKELLIRAAHHGVAQVLGTILFLAGAGIGLSLLFSPDAFDKFGSLSQNFHWVSPPAWAALFIGASIAVVITVWVDTAHAQLPTLALGTIFVAFGVLALFSGAIAIVWAFIALGWISIFTQVICWAKEKRETVLYSHQPN
jgi:hypothetical protein